MAVTVDTGSHYRILQFADPATAGTWDAYGNKQFVSKPACAMRDNGVYRGTAGAGFVIAGKASDGTIYTAAGTMAPVSYPQSNGGANEVFTAVGSDKYTTGGSPALGGGNEQVGTGSMIALVVMGTDSQTIYAYARPLPYLSHAWSSRVQGPKLPTGWSAVGAPAIVELPITFAIVVHAHNSQTNKEGFFYTYIAANTSPPVFSNAIGSPSSSWAQLPLSLQAGQTVNDDPALTSDSTYGLTLWFRSGSQIVETAAATVPTLGTNPPLAIKPADGVSFASAPAATAGVTFEEGQYVVLARRSPDSTGASHLWFITDTVIPNTPNTHFGP